MKLAFAFLFTLFGTGAFGQFGGKLVYQIDQNETRLVMAYYQNGTHGKVEAYNVHLNNGIPDSTTIHPQDTILFDFAAATETHLQHATMMAYKQKYMASMMAAAVNANPKLKGMGTITVTGGGADSANGYSCNHYIMTSASKMGASTKDIWVSSSLGPSPSTWVLGSYLYYTPGDPNFTKLTTAGASGIVVKVNSSYTHQGLQYSMRLISYDPHPPRLLFFSVPTRYTVIDETNMSFPGKSGN